VSWLNPAAAWWLLLVPALVALYLLRPRPVRKPVSSLRLWQKLPQVSRTRARLRPPPKSLLLVMQALLLLAGGLALMQPAHTSPGGRHEVILIDASGSMLADSGGASRFERARAEANSIAAGMAPEDDATLLRVGPAVTTACSACDASDLQRAISELRPGAGRANMQAALSVAAGLARRFGDSGQVVVISDGGFEVAAGDDLPGPVRYIQAGEQDENQGITVLSARQPTDGSPGYIAYARVDNTGASPADVRVEALADTVPLPPRNLTVPPGGHARLTWQLAAGTAKLTVNLQAQDALAADNHAVLFLPGHAEHRVNIVSGEPDLYRRVLAGIPGLDVATGSAEPSGLTILEGALPEALPPGSLLLVNPSGGILPGGQEVRDVIPLGADASHPLLAGVDLEPLQVRKARLFEAPPWLETVVDSGRGPLLLAGEQQGRRVAVLAFDPRDSNLPTLAAFPLLVANLVDWLYPLSGVQALQPGDAIYLAPGAPVTTPSGRAARADARGVFAETDELGIYSVDSPGLGNTFAVNVTDRAESDLAPRGHPELVNPRAPGSGVAAGGPGLPGLQATNITAEVFWQPLAALALLLLGAEWLYYCWRRGSV
jgi:Ca-activated chloride channel homolog